MVDVGKGVHDESTAEDYDILVESTDPDLSREPGSVEGLGPFGWGGVET